MKTRRNFIKSTFLSLAATATAAAALPERKSESKQVSIEPDQMLKVEFHGRTVYIPVYK